MIDTGVQDARALPAGALGAWWKQGIRTALLLKPDWFGLRTTPAIVTCLFLAPELVTLLTERLYIQGPARFYWQALAGGWMWTLLVLWACWILVRGKSVASAPPHETMSLFAMICAQALALAVVSAVVLVPLTRSGAFFEEGPALWLGRIGWFVVLLWLVCAPGLLLARSGASGWKPRTFAVVIVAVSLLGQWLVPVHHWYPAPPANAQNGESARFHLTQEVMERQVEVLQRNLQSLARQRAGVIDLYVLTFAPYSSEDVFRRESDMVAGVMKSRFDAEGRTLQLVNHRATGEELPWATPLNLRRAIQRMAELMDRDEDVLFIHLTSHGARDGALSAEFWPLDVESVTPQMLKAWLDEAGVKNRVISVSACFSGTWILPLADAGTLVMTASDSEHTSYGCGRKSELTYFGRAMYDEGMRKTWSFEEAHAAARSVIAQREKDVGKADGFSNPQISVGDRIRERLRLLEAQRGAAPH